ncbi:hypothetical protein EAO72_15795 [Streptomyces sp. or43]|nr:alpha/beta hydrolase [Streptomyces sp. or43]TXS41975.1 hypothetical protein EAO72_15795 [Streptomyces sp. or43]
MDRALAGAAAVINCAGPFALTGAPVVEAALRAGIPYVDVAAEIEANVAMFADHTEAALDPFFYGRWDEAARDHHAASRPDNPDAVAHFGAEGAFDPPATRAALAAFRSPVLLLAGEFDLNSPPRSVAAFAGLFPDATLVVQEGAGHCPWVDDADRFVELVSAFLA